MLMPNTQQFPVDVHMRWTDYSPALRYHVSERVRSHLAEFASVIRGVGVRISDEEGQAAEHRRCRVEVITTHPNPISASAVGVDVFNLVNQTVDTVAQMLRRRFTAGSENELRRRIA
jgi:hypothetical protein